MNVKMTKELIRKALKDGGPLVCGTPVKVCVGLAGSEAKRKRSKKSFQFFVSLFQSVSQEISLDSRRDEFCFSHDEHSKSIRCPGKTGSDHLPCYG